MMAGIKQVTILFELSLPPPPSRLIGKSLSPYFCVRRPTMYEDRLHLRRRYASEHRAGATLHIADTAAPNIVHAAGNLYNP